MKRNVAGLAVAVLAIALGVSGCASSKKQGPGEPAASASAIEGDIPADHPLARVKIGMSQGHVHEILGQPTDTKHYSTGKVWIPFYFGKDAMRYEELYKGVGRITYTGAGVGGINYKVYHIVYDPAEDGFND
jgi:hypothetical protein